jgi:hypothetical protein
LHSSRKYYYVQISTGVSQWDLPTSEAPIGAGSSHSTPAQTTNPYSTPDEGTRGVPGHGESTDRAGGLGVRSMRASVGTRANDRHRASP